MASADNLPEQRVTVAELTTALLETEVIYLAPERKKLASGRLSSLYFNVGDLVISFPHTKNLVVAALAQTYRESGISSDRLIGVPEGANCLVSSLTDRLGLGQLRVRESKSEHGDQRSIEGNYSEGRTVTVIEDVTSTGGSTENRAINPVRAVGLNPVGFITLIDREYGGLDRMRRLGLSAHAFTTTTEIAEELVRNHGLNDQQLRLLQEELEELKAHKG